MNHKETLNFVAKCLTISLEVRNRQTIENQLKSTNINWDRVVQLSSSHYVLPALYCNLKRSNFLHYLPGDLVTYMEYIVKLNRERNKQIVIQANELNSILLANKITAIFMKGTGNLIAGIYDDLAERMVGDIDFIFSEKDYPKAIKLLRNFGYSEVGDRDYYFPPGKHHTRLQKYNSIAAIEIHSEIMAKKNTEKNLITVLCKRIHNRLIMLGF